MKAIITSALLIAGLAVAQTQATPAKSGASALSSSDQAFLKKATEGNMAEVQLGQLAQQNGSSSVVKQFGEQMVTDHTKLDDQVKSLAAQKGVTLPTSPSAKDKALYKTLSAKTGNAFDKAYISAMIKDHKADIAEFQKVSQSASDPDVKALASSALPTLQEHLQLAEKAAKAVGLSTSTTGGMR